MKKIIIQIFLVLVTLAIIISPAVYYFEISVTKYEPLLAFFSIVALGVSWFVWQFTYKLPFSIFSQSEPNFIELLGFAFWEAVVAMFISVYFRLNFASFLIVFTALFTLTVSALVNSHKKRENTSQINNKSLKV